MANNETTTHEEPAMGYAEIGARIEFIIAQMEEWRFTDAQYALRRLHKKLRETKCAQ